MKVAEARYTGRQRTYTRRGATNERYSFRRNASDPWVPIDNVDDARRLERCSNIEVNWTTLGLVRGKFDGIEEILSQKYREKRSLASELGIEFEGNPDTETLDEQLREHITDLQKRGEL